jgi:hypothetical protein
METASLWNIPPAVEVSPRRLYTKPVETKPVPWLFWAKG